MAGHDANLALTGLDDAGTIGTDEAGLTARAQQALLDTHHVLHTAHGTRHTHTHTRAWVDRFFR